jgi:hypothetical protein
MYALSNAALYCCLMPLWEGFDELYHYGIVEHFATHATLPVIGETTLSRELWTSLDFLPVSHYIEPHLERSGITFLRYFALSAEDRATLRHGADSIDRRWRSEPSPRTDYEAMQAPLTYLFLAPVDWLFSGRPLTSRVLFLRLLLAFAAIVLLWIGSDHFASRLGLQEPMKSAALFVVFSCQMLYAETCRIGNDALVAPWLLFFLVAVAACIETPSFRRTTWMGVLMAAGLLLKASMLIFVPLAFAAPIVILVRGALPLSKAAQHVAIAAGIIGAVAGPWYLRNLTLYHNVSGTIDATAGVGPEQMLQASLHVPWRESIASTMHGALWTGNNSFLTFSGFTLNVALGALALTIVLYLVRARWTAPEWIAMVAIVLYGALMLGVTVSFFYASKGAVSGPMPWYLQVLLVPVVALGFLGLARSARWGRSIAVATVLLWAYIDVVSWIAKLIPLYGGFEQSHARAGELLRWYLYGAAERNSMLATICPAPLPVIHALLAVALATLAVLGIWLPVVLYRTTDVGWPA